MALSKSGENSRSDQRSAQSSVSLGTGGDRPRHIKAEGPRGSGVVPEEIF